MYKIELVNGDIEYWSERIIKKFKPTVDGWIVTHFNNSKTEIKMWWKYS